MQTQTQTQSKPEQQANKRTSKQTNKQTNTVRLRSLGHSALHPAHGMQRTRLQRCSAAALPMAGFLFGRHRGRV
jgi:hypothetical protein